MECITYFLLNWILMIVWAYNFSRNLHTYYFIGTREIKGYKYLFMTIVSFICLLFHTVVLFVMYYRR
jgi:hypothetical protein